jgi:nucleoporin POM34
VSDSPTGSPLWSKALGSARDPVRRSSYGSPSPLGPGLGGRDGGVLGMPSTPSPTGRGASVGLNSKWLYHRGRSSSGGKGGFGGSALVGN